FKQFGGCGPGVEIVIHRLDEFLPQGGDFCQQRIAFWIQLAGRTSGCRLQSEKAAAAYALKPFEKTIKPVQTVGRFLQQFFAVLNRAAVMGGKQKETDCFWLMSSQKIAERAGAGRFADFSGLLG